MFGHTCLATRTFWQIITLSSTLLVVRVEKLIGVCVSLRTKNFELTENDVRLTYARYLTR